METMERKKPRPRRSFTPEFKAEFAQILPHKTPEWQKVYATLRNSVEGMNGFIKDGAREAIDDPERRRIRGAAGSGAPPTRASSWPSCCSPPTCARSTSS